MAKFSLTIDERALLKAGINLEQYGFEKTSGYEYKNKDYFHVLMGDWCAVFSSGSYTTPVEYDKLEEWLLEKGYSKN